MVRSLFSLLFALALLSLARSAGHASPNPPPNAAESSQRSSPQPLCAGDERRSSKLALTFNEPGNCTPLCRPNFYCKRGKCVSLCNPRCPKGQRCVRGDCEPLPRPGEPTRFRYLALTGGTRIGLSNQAETVGELRLEIGGRYVALQIGPSFGAIRLPRRQNTAPLTAIRAAIIGHVALQPWRSLPLFLMPTLGMGFSYNWIDDFDSTRQANIFIVPGLRLRYDVLPRLALFCDPIQIEVDFLRLQTSKSSDLARAPTVPVMWGMHLGAAFLY